MVKAHTFDGKKDGPHLLVFGAIHGEEPCGAFAIEQAARLLEKEWLRLKAGRLTMVPVCNPRAFEKNVPFIDKNLNRIFHPHANPVAYEEHLANTLTAFVDECDYFLDLHSQTSDGPPLVFQESEDEKTEAFARAINVPYRLKGWAEMADENPAGEEMHTTERYAHEQGKPGILVECGQNSDPRAPAVAYSAIIDSLIHLGIIEAPETNPACEQKIIRMHSVLRNFAEGGALAKRWKHLQSVPAGEILALSNSGRVTTMPWQGVIILPKNGKNIPPGGELGYLGQPENSLRPDPL